MNVYDEAHSLAKAIKESNEFKEFDRIRKEEGVGTGDNLARPARFVLLAPNATAKT